MPLIFSEKSRQIIIRPLPVRTFSETERLSIASNCPLELKVKDSYYVDP